MKKEEALNLVNSYFDKKNKDNNEFVMTYSSRIKKNLVKWFNFMKYRVRLSILRKIEISDYLKPDAQEKEKYMINFRGVYEAKYFWIVHWGMTKFIEELDIRDALIGAGPIVVSKRTSRLFHTSTSMLDIMEEIKNDIDIDLKLLEEFGSEIK